MSKENAAAGYRNRPFSLRHAVARLGPAVLIALLGAHFLRASAYGLVLCCLGVLLLHCGQAAWKRYAVSFFLLWGAFEWGTTALFLAEARMQSGLPWFRASLILMGVALVTSLGAAAYYAQSVKKEDLDEHARLKALVFIGSFCAIRFLAQASPVPLLLLERFIPRWGDAQIFLMAWYSVFAMTLLLDPRRSRRGRKLIWLTFSFVFFSQLILGLLGIERMLMTGTLHMPVPGFILFGPAFRGSLGIMAALVLTATLLLGSAWCGMLCYFGPFDLCAAGNKPMRPLPPALQWMMRHGRLCILISGVSVAAFLGAATSSAGTALAASAVFIGATVLMTGFFSRKYASMIHCTAFCPMGFVVNTLGKLSPWRVVIDKEKCDHCGACEEACKYRAISFSSRSKGRTHFQCSLCLDCLPACKKQAITITTPRIPLSGSTARHTFLALTVIVHTVFLAFARV